MLVMVAMAEDVTHLDDLAGIQVHYHCIPSDEKIEIYLPDCGGGHDFFRRLDVDAYHFQTDTVSSISMISSMKLAHDLRLEPT